MTALLLCVFALFFVSVFTFFLEAKMAALLEARQGPARPTLSWQTASRVAKKSILRFVAADRFLPISLQLGLLMVALGTTPFFLGGAETERSEVSVFFPVFAIFLSFSLMTSAMSRRHDNLSEIRWARAVFRMMSAACPVVLILLSVGGRSGGFSWEQIIEHQTGFLHRWNLFSSPLGIGEAIIFILSGWLMLHQHPFTEERFFSAHEGSIDLWFLEYAKKIQAFLWCIFVTHLFLGGWDAPFASAFFEAASVFGKSAGVYLLTAFFLRVVPSVSIVKVSKLVWAFLTPLAILCVIVSLMLMEWSR